MVGNPIKNGSRTVKNSEGHNAIDGFLTIHQVKGLQI